MQRELSQHKPWDDLLEEEDLAFIKRFVLASGSLKEMAQAYQVSYPTVRLRLDRLIQKIKILDDQVPASDFERLLRLLHVEGKINMNTLKALLAAHRNEMEGQDEVADSSS